jgi:signal transduction histidine kinase
VSLRTRLLALFLLVAVVPLLALGGVEYARSLRALEVMIAAQNARVADRVADLVRARAALLQSDLHLLAENAETQRWLLRLAEGASDPDAAREADRFLRDAWARMGSSYGALTYADPHQRELYRMGASAGGFAGGAGELLQPVSLSITHPGTNVPLGTVTLLPALAAIFPVDLLASGFGETGHGMVLDRESGRFVYHSDPAMRGAEFTSLISSDSWHVTPQALAQPQGTFRYRSNDTLRVASFVSLPSPSWTVVVSGSVDEFAGPFTEVRRWTLVLFLVVAIGATLVFSHLLRRTTRSLEELTAATAVVGSGNLTPVLPAAGRDEVGRLTRSFETMVREIRAMVSQIESSRQMAVLGQFAAQLSHEIRNPLTSIKLNLQKLERTARDGRMPDDAARPLEIALREVGRLDTVVRGVLHLTRDRPPGVEIVALHRLADEVLEVVAAQAEGRRVAVERAYDATADHVRVDPAQVKGALLNLLLNALDAMPNGGTLRLRSTCSGDRIALGVSDTGGGVAVEMRDEVFRPFYTTKESGTGLGLPLAKRAIEDNGGTLVLADSVEGPRSNAGAEFVIDLPLALDA